MAYVEPMDVDNIGSDFDDKENSLQNGNVLSRTPCMEKGYDELDMSELNMKLRYSITPASSPMSKSYVANYKEKSVNQENISNMKENINLSLSLNSTLTKSDTTSKSPKLPLQVVSSDQFLNNTITSSMRRSIDTDTNNCTITLTGTENDENLSLPSTSSSSVHTPEATTPTKDMTKTDGGSPIMRGLKNVLNMFRSTPSPIPPEEISNKNVSVEQPVGVEISLPTAALASTPISSKRTSPLKDSVIFNDDLEKELRWKEETTIIFKQEKIPINKLFFQETVSAPELKQFKKANENLNSTLEYMDISYNESGIADKTMTEVENKNCSNVVEAVSGFESDSEFLDCETSYSKNEEISQPQKDVADLEENNETKDVPDLKENNEIKDVPDLIENNETKVNPDLIENNEVKGSITKTVEANFDEEYTSSNDNRNSTNQTTESIQCEIKTELNVTYEESANQDVVMLPTISSESNTTITVSVNTSDMNDFNLNSTLVICDNSNQQLSASLDVDQNTEDNFISMENVKENVATLIERNANEIKEKPEFEIEEKCPHDVTKPLNIITNYETNTETSASSDIKNDFGAGLVQNIGLLKRYDVEKNEETVRVRSESIEENRNVTLDNTMTNTQNLIRDVNDASIDDKTIDINNTETVESTKIDSLEETTNTTLNKYSIDYHTEVNIDSSTNNSAVLDVTNNICNTKTQDKNEIVGNVELQLNTSEEKTNEEIEKISGMQEPLLNVPSECPLPYDDDGDSRTLKDAAESDHNNTVIVHSNGNDENLERKNNLNEEVYVFKHMEILPDDTTADKTIGLIDTPETPTQAIDKLDNMSININLNVNGNMSALNVDLNKTNIIEEDNGICMGNVKNQIVTLPNNVSSDDLNSHQQYIEIENIRNPFETKVKLRESPPLSPKLDQEPYDCDIVNDPFVTKTKIRTSPTPEISLVHTVKGQNKIEQKRVQMRNRRKSQPLKKSVKSAQTKFNKSFESGLQTFTNEHIDASEIKELDDTTISAGKENVIMDNNNTDEIVVSALNSTQTINCSVSEPNNDARETEVECKNEIDFCDVEKSIEVEMIHDKKNETQTEREEEKKTYDNKVSEDFLAPSSASRSVFNIPEIDDINFNPFATKSKVRESPPPTFETSKVINKIKCEQTMNDFEVHVTDDTNNESRSADNINLNFEIQNKSKCANDVTVNLGNTAQEQSQSPNVSLNLSRNTENNEITANEVHTEDEDTIEGPFFESDELTDVEKLLDFGLNNELTPFDNFPADANTDKQEEIFIDAEAFEFLLNQNKSNVVADSGKESLFLKFDPLFAKRTSSNEVVTALSKVQKKQSTPLKPDKINETLEKLPSTASSLTTTVSEECYDESNVVAPKPMMVVNPAVNLIVSPRKSITPPRVNRRSLTFTSPAMAVIDRLLSLSGNNSLLDHDITTSEQTRECNNTDIALTQLRELLAEKEIHVHNLRTESKELKERLSVMESQVKALEEESNKRLKKVNDLNERLAEKTKINKSMAVVVEEYERTIASLIAEMDQEKRRNAEERKILISERDEQTAHLASMEVSFSDLHSKYEKSKQIILSMKANEDTYRKSIREFEDNLLKMQKNYEMLKQHATSKLNYANQELEKYNRSHEAEVLKLNAMIKRKELHITSLEESLTQKTKANEELTAICDELINKVG